jgi:hypothetical protein
VSLAAGGRGQADGERAEALMKSADAEVATLTGLLQRGDRAGIRKFIASNWYAVSDPLSDQLDQLYQTLQSEARNDFQDLTRAMREGEPSSSRFIIIGLGVSDFHRMDRLARRDAFAGQCAQSAP